MSTMRKGRELKKHILYPAMDDSFNLTLMVRGCNSSFILTVWESPELRLPNQTVTQGSLGQHSFWKKHTGHLEVGLRMRHVK